MDDLFEHLDVRCAIHGPMRYRFNMDWWNCVGFDGDECNSLLTAEVAFEIVRGGPITDERCLPVQWYHNQLTDILEIVVGGKDAKAPDAHVVQN